MVVDRGSGLWSFIFAIYCPGVQSNLTDLQWGWQSMTDNIESHLNELMDRIWSLE